jgi:hypothetical protein
MVLKRSIAEVGMDNLQSLDYPIDPFLIWSAFFHLLASPWSRCSVIIRSGRSECGTGLVTKPHLAHLPVLTFVSHKRYHDEIQCNPESYDRCFRLNSYSSSVKQGLAANRVFVVGYGIWQLFAG